MSEISLLEGRRRLLAASLLGGPLGDAILRAALTNATLSVEQGHAFEAALPALMPRLLAEEAALIKLGAVGIGPDDAAFPAGAPLGVLRVRGTLPPPGVAIVGSRRADAYGLELASRVAQAAVRAGFAVISGGAYGVDIAAHRAALQAGGQTVVVLGAGLNQAGPAPHRATFERAASAGAVVSPFACDQGASTWTFPKRNPWIAALARVVVVIQATAASGTLSTARAALGLGRPVFAAPGPLDSPLHVGCHALVDAGARLLTSVEGFLSAPSGPARPAPHSLTGAALKLYEAASVEPTALEQLAERAGLSVAEASSLATILELQGHLRSTGGGRFVQARSLS